MNSLMSVMYVKLVLRAEAEGERNLFVYSTETLTIA